MRLSVICFLLVGCSSAVNEGLAVESPSPAIADGHLIEAVGIETLGGMFTPLLLKGCAVPCEVTQVFGTADDNQSELLIHLFRGNGALVKETHDLGTYRISGIRAAPRGEAQVKVGFAATLSGLKLDASEVGSGSTLQIARAAP